MGSFELPTKWQLKLQESWLVALQQLHEREEKKLQPPLPGADVQTILVANAVYLFVSFALYQLMKNRRNGFRLNNVILIYDTICMLVSGYVVIGVLLFKLEKPGTFVCNELAVDKRGHQLSFVFWVFYMLKYWEYLHTWLLILRKSFQQVTFLHLFHHISITLVVGSIIQFDFSGDMYLPVLSNSFVHVLMYLHYLLTAFGLNSWWRPYLTTLQIFQFFLIGGQSIIALSKGSDCGSPDFAKVILIGFMWSMIMLFVNFFIGRYIFQEPSASMAGVIKSLSPPELHVYSGNISLNKAGGAKVTLPFVPSKSFVFCNSDYHYQLTPIGEAMANLHVAQELYLDEKDGKICYIISGGSAWGKVSWLVRINNSQFQDKENKTF